MAILESSILLKKYIDAQRQIENIVRQYEDYKATHEVDKYLRAISYKIKRYEDKLIVSNGEAAERNNESLEQ